MAEKNSTFKTVDAERLTHKATHSTQD